MSDVVTGATGATEAEGVGKPAAGTSAGAADEVPEQVPGPRSPPARRGAHFGRRRGDGKGRERTSQAWERELEERRQNREQPLPAKPTSEPRMSAHCLGGVQRIKHSTEVVQRSQGHQAWRLEREPEVRFPPSSCPRTARRAVCSVQS